MKNRLGRLRLEHLLVVASVTLAGSFATASAGTHECFRAHLREAIELNAERLPLYSALSRGRSEEISKRMISMEKLALTSSHFTHDFDRPDRVYQWAGVHVMCENFVPMAKTPAFRPSFIDGAPSLSSFKDLKPLEMKRRLKTALREHGFEGVRREAEIWLAHLSEPRLNCMMRHTLESIVRVATLAPRHAQKARTLSLPSPEKLERKLIESHWSLLVNVHWLDEKAARLQSEGLPILCNDVPSLAL